MDKRNALKRLLSPESIAVLGGNSASQVIRQCRKVGFAGDIWPVHPSRSDIEGIPCFPSVAEMPGTPDGAFIGVGPDLTVQLVSDLALRGAGGAVCYAAGFAEADDNGKARQHALLEAAGPMALMGPNCHGFVNYLDGVALWPDEHGGERSDSGVAFVMQSGNIGISLTMQRRSLPVSYMITVGNMADLEMHDYINALLDDQRVTAIGLYIEGLDNIPAFTDAALRALEKGVPIVALKSGTSTLGAAAAMSHTSSLAGSNDFYDAMFDRYGIARCHTLEEFLETLKFVSLVGPLDGQRITSMSCSGGDASMVADHSELLGLELPPLSEATEQTLHGILGDRVHTKNPLDYHTYIWGDYDALRACFAAVLAEGADCNLLVMDYPHKDVSDAEVWKVTENALLDAMQDTGRKAVIVSSMAENIPAVARNRLLSAGIVPMQGLRECLLAIRSAAKIGAASRRVADLQPLPAVLSPDGTRTVMDEWQSKTTLAGFGLPVPEGRCCAADDVAAAAMGIGFPVCLKIVSADITHKTDVGGVFLGIPDLAELSAALEAVKPLSEQFLVEKMAPEPVAELIVGIKRESGFGLALVIGAGGVLVELLEDTATLLLPASRSEIEETLDSLKIMRLIAGFRGRPGGDRQALVDAVAAIADYGDAHRDTLLELDVNPLMVFDQGVSAVDALVVVSD